MGPWAPGDPGPLGPRAPGQASSSSSSSPSATSNDALNHDMNAHSATRHQSIVTSMQPLLGIIIWHISMQKQPCAPACIQECATQCMQLSPDSTIRNAPHQPSPQPPATSHGTGTSHHPSHQPPAMAPAPPKCPRYYPQNTANSPTPRHRPSHSQGHTAPAPQNPDD